MSCDEPDRRGTMIPPWLESLLACPRCHGALRRGAAAFECRECGVDYPVRRGIPDFRLRPDPYISIEAEVEKVERLTADPELGFRGLLDRYYDISPENPPRLHRHYVRAMEAAPLRGAALLRRLRCRFPGAPDSTLLDLGCGTAGMVVAGSRSYRRVVGVDVALRWLVIGARRLREEGIEAPLVCANAEHLPLRDGTIDAVAADALLEHVRDPRLTVDETERVLVEGGTFVFRTNNRFSLLPEPHVRIWGLGWLPFRWRRVLARRLRDTPYEARLLSRSELQRLFDGLGVVELPTFDDRELRASSEPLERIWEAVRRLPVLPRLMAPFVPLYDVFGRKGGAGTQPP